VGPAPDAYDLALTVNHRLRAPLFVARTRLAHAELLAEAEAEPDRARSLATEAKTTAAQFGFAHIGRRTGQLLERLS
jgi:hypothetical protein